MNHIRGVVTRYVSGDLELLIFYGDIVHSFAFRVGGVSNSLVEDDADITARLQLETVRHTV